MTVYATPIHSGHPIAHDLPRDAADRSHFDAQVLARYQEVGAWGLSAAIDLGACQPAAIRDAGHLERFVGALCELIAMRRFGAPTIVRFGADQRVCGYSLTQLIETSLISGHFAEESNSAYIDIFSCKPYPPCRAAAFCQQWFGALTCRLGVAYRYAGATSQDAAAGGQSRAVTEHGGAASGERGVRRHRAHAHPARRQTSSPRHA